MGGNPCLIGKEHVLLGRDISKVLSWGIAMWAKRKTGYIVNSHRSCQCLTECRKVIISTVCNEESYSGFAVPRGEERSVESLSPHGLRRKN